MAEAEKQIHVIGLEGEDALKCLLWPPFGKPHICRELLASADVKLAKWQEAKQAFERILTFKPDDVDSLFGLGQCELELKNYQAAVDKLQLVLRLAPTRLLAHYYLSRAYVGHGEDGRGAARGGLHQLMMEQMTFVRAVEREGSEAPIQAPAAQMLGRTPRRGCVAAVSKTLPGNVRHIGGCVCVCRETVSRQRSKLKTGLRCLHHALELEPTVRGAHTYEGILRLKLGDLNAAESEFKAELANDPNYQTAIAEMGEVRYQQQRWSDAAEQLAKSRTMNPELLYMLCDSYFRLGKVSDADLNAETAAAYGRNNPEFMKDLIDLLQRNGQTELAQRLSGNLAQK